MSDHNIIGHERSGPHFVVRTYRTPAHRRASYWLTMAAQFVVLGLIVMLAWVLAVTLIVPAPLA